MAHQMEAGDVSKGDYVIIDDEPCEVQEASKSMAGKHGHAKVSIRAEGVFDGQSYNGKWGADDKLLTPNIQKKTGQVVSKDGTVAQVMDMDTYETEEMQLPDDLDVAEGEEISFWEIEDRKLVKGKAN
ncbi:MAG: translation initiation factor IF-5A [Candidatus Nanohaloarchaea archaeon]|nr:translation initiation factor IF-5A [Candidatus Nanohaloarchaea archaeon]